MAAAAAAALLCASCSAPVHPAEGAAGHLLRSDDWSLPAAVGPPGPATFCLLLTALYRHEAKLPEAADKAVKEQFLHDYVAAVPRVEAEAPPALAAAARTYLGAVARILSAMAAAGLDYRKVPAGTLAPVLLDPSVKAAGNQVLAYSETTCHYDIANP